MLSSSPIKAGGAGVADYYDKLAREDYYTHGGEPPISPAQVGGTQEETWHK